MNKFCVTVKNKPGSNVDSEYFINFYDHCANVAYENQWDTFTVMNYQLRPHGRLIQTKTQGWYLRWDDEKYHTAFVLKWS